MLHYDKELFEQVVLRTSEYLQIDAAIIEKDYYVTLLLQEIVKMQPDIIFKGGTSLSKCYRIIDRFSEDIDLTIFLDEKPTESQRKQLKENIVSAIKNQKMECGDAYAESGKDDTHKDLNDESGLYQTAEQVPVFSVPVENKTDQGNDRDPQTEHGRIDIGIVVSLQKQI